MFLTPEQQAILDGSQGTVIAKIMETLILYGEAMGAEKMVPVSPGNSRPCGFFGLKTMEPVFHLAQQFIDAGAVLPEAFSVIPQPMDEAIPVTRLQKHLFEKRMYSPNSEVPPAIAEEYACACFPGSADSLPNMGDILSWSDSTAIAYANTVLGARCNRNSGIIDIMGTAVGYVPYFGLLTDEGRKASWVVRIETTRKPKAHLLGAAVGRKVVDGVPYIIGMEKWLGPALTEENRGYIKDFGAAAASHGAIGLSHFQSITPEAAKYRHTLISENPKEYVIDDAELQRVKESFPLTRKNRKDKPNLCFVGCPHLNYQQLEYFTIEIEYALKRYNRTQVLIPTVLSAAPAVRKKFEESEFAPRLAATGVTLSSVCPMLFLNNPLVGSVITNSNVLRIYSNARYYPDYDLILRITKGDQ